MTVDYASSADAKRSSPLLVLLAWMVVGLPALWGVAMSARAAMQLFHPPPAQTVTSPAAPSGGK